MEKPKLKNIRLVQAAVVFVLVVSLALLYSVLSQNSLLPKITINLHPSAQQEGQAAPESSGAEEAASPCPSQLDIGYFADAHGTSALEDDDLYLTIYNPDLSAYDAQIYINGNPDSAASLPPDTRTSVYSSLITEWWRASHRDEDAEDEPLAQDTPQQGGFTVSITVRGCDSQVLIITPENPSGGGGIGSADSSDGGQYGSFILITKSKTQYLDD